MVNTSYSRAAEILGFLAGDVDGTLAGKLHVIEVQHLVVNPAARPGRRSDAPANQAG
jgi:hypothetical protein